MVALYRPGPMEFIPSYIKRMHGLEKIVYRHESLTPILEETFGITVYQEQIMYTAMEVGGYTASEADFLRKAVSKKKESDLLKNREKFVQGAIKNGVPIEAAELIFADWEAFARYGFPKGHAADYAVIAVETAYLKCHYPVEFMTALLSVFKGSTERIAGYIADCREMEIAVLQPDINRSGWDFTIEDNAAGASAIRFGLGAIKNVGHGPVEVILEARQEGPFVDLNDLAERVDMRKVGKRALESLIMAGALDEFGPRLALLDVMERLSSISASTFQAAEAGQLTFFGRDAGLTQRITLKPVADHVNQREMLNWERDLIGLYISDHPLNRYLPQLKGQISHFSSQLAGVNHEAGVRVFGQVNRIRNHITRNGKPMAFVGLEDTQGVIDLVVFPRVWDQFKDLIKFDSVLIVDGKVDNENGEPKVLVNAMRAHFHSDKPAPEIETGQFTPTRELDEMPAPYIQRGAGDLTFESEEDHFSAMDDSEMHAMHEDEDMDHPEDDPVIIDDGLDRAHAIPRMEPVLAEEPALYQSGDDQPPPPPPFEDDWIEQIEAKPGTSNRNGVVKPAGIEKKAQIIEQPIVTAAHAGDQQPSVQETPPPTKSERKAQPPVPAPPAVDVQSAVHETVENKPLSFIALPAERPAVIPNRNEPQFMITIVVRASKDKARDILRIRRIHGRLLSYPGDDKFAIYLIENGKGIQLEFPNDTTNIHDELRSWLEAVVGVENIKIERITLQ
jgi:DNA polymerase-3 subunit alpha